MFGIGTPELLIIIVVALIILGPKKLPELMRSMGKGIAEFKRVSNDVKGTLDAEIKQAEEAVRKQDIEEEMARRKAEKAKAEAAEAAETGEAGVETGEAAESAETSAEPEGAKKEEAGESA